MVKKANILKKLAKKFQNYDSLNVLICTHTDLDGQGSLFAAQHALAEYFPDTEVNITVVLINYPKTPEAAELPPDSFDLGFILDHSFTEPTIPILKHIHDKIEPGNLIWFDHHIVSNDILALKLDWLQDDYVVIDDNRAGALITWDELVGGKAPRGIQLTDDYDRWVHSDPDSRALNCVAYDMSYPINDEDFTEAMLGNDEVLEEYLVRGRQLYRREQAKHWGRRKRGLMRAQLPDGTWCYAINTFGFNSDIFGGVYKDAIVCVLYFWDGDSYNYSLYSNGNFDCAAFCKKYGGGGHVGAAGCATPELLVNNTQRVTGTVS
jgi:oligoribonuclease NrnB/cAMP/cGMP phosphodiesterase (DHH superfamily)